MSDDHNVIHAAFGDTNTDPDVEVLYRSTDEVMLSYEPTDEINIVGVRAMWHALFGPSVQLGDYDASPAEARWLASELIAAANHVDPDRESVLHTRTQIEAERARLFGDGA